MRAGALRNSRLAGQRAGEFVDQPLVLAKQVADLTPAHADVACGHIALGADVPAAHQGATAATGEWHLHIDHVWCQLHAATCARVVASKQLQGPW